MTGTMYGTIKAIHERGFGFITGDGPTGLDYFFHRDTTPAWTELREGDAVTFEPTAGAKGPRAINVVLVPAPEPAA